MEFCPVGYTIDIISKKWCLYIIRELGTGKKRFGELYGALSWGISPKTLTDRLKELEAEGIVIKKSFAEIPPRVEYQLSQRGLELVESFRPIESWSRKWNVLKE